jgi:hypothetical protein
MHVRPAGGLANGEPSLLAIPRALHDEAAAASYFAMVTSG